MKSGPSVTGPGKRQEIQAGLVSRGSAPESVGIIDDPGGSPSLFVALFFLRGVGIK